MALSDKVRQVAFTLAVGSIGAVLGYVGNDVAKFMGEIEMRKKSAAEEQAHREYMERIDNLVNLYTHVPPISNYLPPEPNVSFCLPISACTF